MKSGCQGDTEDGTAVDVPRARCVASPVLWKSRTRPRSHEQQVSDRRQRARFDGEEEESTGAEKPNLPVSPGVFIFNRGATKERLKLPTNFTKLPVE